MALPWSRQGGCGATSARQEGASRNVSSTAPAVAGGFFHGFPPAGQGCRRRDTIRSGSGHSPCPPGPGGGLAATAEGGCRRLWRRTHCCRRRGCVLVRHRRGGPPHRDFYPAHHADSVGLLVAGANHQRLARPGAAAPQGGAPRRCLGNDTSLVGIISSCPRGDCALCVRRPLWLVAIGRLWCGSRTCG